MSNSSIFSGSGAEDNDDGFVVLNESEREDAGLPISDSEERAALPVPLYDEDDDDEHFRNAIDLDDIGGNNRQPLDLDSLIGQLSQPTKKIRKPEPTSEAESQRLTPDSSAQANASMLHEASRLEIVRLKEEVEKERNNVRRAMADLINYRRKAETDRHRYVQDAIEGFAKKVVEVMDDFERGLKTTSETKNYDLLAEGVAAILRNFESMLSGYDIKHIDTVGKLFDVELHEAMGTDLESDLPEDTIVEELRRGYTIDGRLLRAAMVKVARKPDALAPVDLDSDIAQSEVISNTDPDSETIPSEIDTAVTAENS